MPDGGSTHRVINSVLHRIWGQAVVAGGAQERCAKACACRPTGLLCTFLLTGLGCQIFAAPFPLAGRNGSGGIASGTEKVIHSGIDNQVVNPASRFLVAGAGRAAGLTAQHAGWCCAGVGAPHDDAVPPSHRVASAPRRSRSAATTVPGCSGPGGGGARPVGDSRIPAPAHRGGAPGCGGP